MCNNMQALPAKLLTPPGHSQSSLWKRYSNDQCIIHLHPYMRGATHCPRQSASWETRWRISYEWQRLPHSFFLFCPFAIACRGPKWDSKRNGWWKKIYRKKQPDDGGRKRPNNDGRCVPARIDFCPSLEEERDKEKAPIHKKKGRTEEESKQNALSAFQSPKGHGHRSFPLMCPSWPPLYASPLEIKDIPLNFKTIGLLYVQWATALHAHNRCWKALEVSSAQSIYGSILRYFKHMGLVESDNNLTKAELLMHFGCETVYEHLNHLLRKCRSKKYVADQVCELFLPLSKGLDPL